MKGMAIFLLTLLKTYPNAQSSISRTNLDARLVKRGRPPN
jgi:hypothetical protein